LDDKPAVRTDRCQKVGINYFVILEQQGVITSLLPALPHDYSPGSWTAAPERITVGLRQDCYAKLVAWTPPSSPDFCTESAAEPFRLEQAMIPQQAMSNDPLSPHTPSPLPADADATVTGTDMVYLADLQPQPAEWLWQHRLAAGTSAMISGEPGSGKTWVALATLRRAKFDIGVRSSKDGKSGAWWWTLPHPEDEYPPVNQARCSN
jgi:hypothetical protein